MSIPMPTVEQLDAVPGSTPAVPVKDETPTPPAAEPEKTVEETAPVDEEKTREEEKEKRENHDVRRMRRYIREAEQAKAEARILREQLAARDQQQQPQQSAAPQREQYATDEDFAAAVVQHKENEIAERVAQRVAQQLGSQSQPAASEAEFAKGIREIRKEDPDYDDKIADLAHLKYDASVIKEITSMTHGPRVMHYLANNPDVAEDLAAMRPTQAMIALGKIEAKIEAERAAPKPVSKAKPPIDPIGTRGSGKRELSDAEWIKAEKERVRSLKK